MKQILIIILSLLPIFAFSQEKIGSWGEFQIKKFLFENDLLQLNSNQEYILFEVKTIGNIDNQGAFEIDIPFNLGLAGYKYGEQRGVLITSMIRIDDGYMGQISYHYSIDEFLELIRGIKKLNPSKKAVSTNYLYITKDGIKVEVGDDLNRGYSRYWRIWISTETGYRVHEIQINQLEKIIKKFNKYFGES